VAAVGAVVIIMVAGFLAFGTVEFTVTGPVVAAIALAVFLAAALIARRPVPPPAPDGRWPPPARGSPTAH
jgi:hypothetical protein